MDEFKLISSYFKPLTAESNDQLESYQLLSDAASFKAKVGQQLIFTKDMMVEGVHYFSDVRPDLLAKKLLRVNLSDLAATGAKPVGYLLGLSLKSVDDVWMQGFVKGLAEDQERFDVFLMGGDTVRIPDTAAQVLSLTAIGIMDGDYMPLSRMGAEVDDLICVTGTIGDAHFGFQQLSQNQDDVSSLTDRLLLPEPRLNEGQMIRRFASACADVSDGLLVDLSHILKNADDQKGLGADIQLSDIPISQAVSDIQTATRLCDKDLFQALLNGGEDYELVFTVSSPNYKKMMDIYPQFGDTHTVIGRVTKKRAIQCLDQNGNDVPIEIKGWNHFNE